MTAYEQLNKLTATDLKLYEGQLRLRAPRLGQALGFHGKEYFRVRQIIYRRRDELERPAYGGTIPQIEGKSTGGRPPIIDLLTVTQSMLICMFSDAPNAPDVREQIILAANAWYQAHPESLPFINALLVPEPLKTEGNVTWLPPEQIADDQDAEPVDECERRELTREQERSRKTVEQLRLFGAQGRFAFDQAPAEKVVDDVIADDHPYYGWLDDTTRITPADVEALPHTKKWESLSPRSQDNPNFVTPSVNYAFLGAIAEGSRLREWQETEKGTTYNVALSFDSDGDPFWLLFEREGRVYVPTTLCLPHASGNGKQVRIHANHIIPLAVIERAYERIGRGPLSDVALATLRHFLAF